MQFTYYGHSCFAVNAGSKTILFDPFITYNELAKHIHIKDIKADTFCNHMDTRIILQIVCRLPKRIMQWSYAVGKFMNG